MNPPLISYSSTGALYYTFTTSMEKARDIGKEGEEHAVTYLIGSGHEVIERNFTRRGGEIDIITEKEGVTHFYEVKYKRKVDRGYPDEMFTPGKRTRYFRIVDQYCHERCVDRGKIGIHLLCIYYTDGKLVHELYADLYNY